MYYVYVLRSKSTGKLYKGFSSDLRKRLKQHFAGNVYSTSRMGEVELAFYEAFIKESDAKRREQYFKTTKGTRMLKLILKDYLAPFVPRTRAELGSGSS